MWMWMLTMRMKITSSYSSSSFHFSCDFHFPSTKEFYIFLFFATSFCDFILFTSYVALNLVAYSLLHLNHFFFIYSILPLILFRAKKKIKNKNKMKIRKKIINLNWIRDILFSFHVFVLDDAMMRCDAMSWLEMVFFLLLVWNFCSTISDSARISLSLSAATSRHKIPYFSGLIFRSKTVASGWRWLCNSTDQLDARIMWKEIPFKHN